MPTGSSRIVFKFSDSANEGDIASSLKDIQKLKGIFNTQAVPNDKKEGLSERTFTAYVDADAGRTGLLDRVKEVAHVEHAAFLPTKRLPPPQRRRK